MARDEQTVYGKWVVRSVCHKCDHNIESPSFGDTWFTDNDYPVCPKCGTHHPWVAKTMPIVSKLEKRFFGWTVKSWYLQELADQK
jgi:hypothetical protein